jgi:hypothetical protein
VVAACLLVEFLVPSFEVFNSLGIVPLKRCTEIDLKTCMCFSDSSSDFNLKGSCATGQEATSRNDGKKDVV